LVLQQLIIWLLQVAQAEVLEIMLQEAAVVVEQVVLELQQVLLFLQVAQLL
jgi:hypothetical protein